MRGAASTNASFPTPRLQAALGLTGGGQSGTPANASNAAHTSQTGTASPIVTLPVSPSVSNQVGLIASQGQGGAPGLQAGGMQQYVTNEEREKMALARLREHLARIAMGQARTPAFLARLRDEANNFLRHGDPHSELNLASRVPAILADVVSDVSADLVAFRAISAQFAADTGEHTALTSGAVYGPFSPMRNAKFAALWNFMRTWVFWPGATQTKLLVLIFMIFTCKIVFVTGRDAHLGYRELSFRHHCLDGYVRTPSCVDVLYAKNWRIALEGWRPPSTAEGYGVEVLSTTWNEKMGKGTPEQILKKLTIQSYSYALLVEIAPVIHFATADMFVDSTWLPPTKNITEKEAYVADAGRFWSTFFGSWYVEEYKDLVSNVEDVKEIVGEAVYVAQTTLEREVEAVKRRRMELDEEERLLNEKRSKEAKLYAELLEIEKENAIVRKRLGYSAVKTEHEVPEALVQAPNHPDHAWF